MLLAQAPAVWPDARNSESALLLAVSCEAPSKKLHLRAIQSILELRMVPIVWFRPCTQAKLRQNPTVEPRHWCILGRVADADQGALGELYDAKTCLGHKGIQLIRLSPQYVCPGMVMVLFDCGLFDKPALIRQLVGAI